MNCPVCHNQTVFTEQIGDLNPEIMEQFYDCATSSPHHHFTYHLINKVPFNLLIQIRHTSPEISFSQYYTIPKWEVRIGGFSTIKGDKIQDPQQAVDLMNRCQKLKVFL